jgi:cation diffusion facilitator CzcD-associated flavoprotein CzcO
MNAKSLDCCVVGAGPYGLSSAAYLRAAGISTRVFGQPMSFWKQHMPARMCLRSPLDGSNLSDPERKFTLKRPLMRFVAGADFATRTLARYIVSRRERRSL